MEQQEWTIMIYMAGDNNLSVDMSYAMQQIKELGGKNSTNHNLFVYYDGYSASIPTLYCDFSNCNHPKQIRSYMVQDKLFPTEPKHNENAADYRSVLNFVDWCANRVQCEKHDEIQKGRKADRYALIFSGHSMGFQDIGLFKDEGSDKTMDMKTLKWMLNRITKTEEELKAEADSGLGEEEFRRATTEILGQKIDLLGFDSCVMSMLEVGNQFDSVAETMIASEGSVPAAGWTYGKILGHLAREAADMPTKEIAANFVNEFVRSQDSYTIGGIAVDMAAWDMKRLPQLNTAFGKLAASLLDCFSDKGSTIYKQMERVMLQVHWKCQTYMYDQNVDLGDFCELLKAECFSLQEEIGTTAVEKLETVVSACDEVLHELKNCVILSGFSGGTYQFSNGISLFLPWTLGAYEVSKANYSTLDFVAETEAGRIWNMFLAKYLGEVTRRPSPGPTETATSAPRGIILESALAATAGDVMAYEQTESKLRYYSYEYADDLFEDKVKGQHMHSSTKLAGQEGSKLAGQEGSKLAGQEGSKLAGMEGSKLAGMEGSKLAGQEGSKLAGMEGSKLAGQEGSKLAGQEGSKLAGQEGSKLAGMEGSKLAGQEGSKLAGQEGSKLAGQEGSKLAGMEGSKLAGQEGSKLAGQEGSKLAGQEGSKLAGQEGSKLAGQEGSKLAGMEGSKLAGQEGSKLAGMEGSKLAGMEGSKLAGMEGSKLAGMEGSKLAGQEGSKLAGMEGSKLAGGGSSSFFESFKNFKNIEMPWNISGFTKDPEELLKDKNFNKTAGGTSQS